MRNFFSHIVANNDPHTYQTTILGQEISTDEDAHLYIGIIGMQLSPASYYRGGYSVFSLMGNIENNHATYLYLFNHRTNQITMRYNWGNYPSGDYHSWLNPVILPDGRILGTVESDHNTQFIVKRSVRPYDITEYEDIATINDDVAYNNLILLGDRLWIICRSFPLIENGVRYSDDYGETWSSLTTILNTGTYANYWAYPKSVYSTTKLMFFMSLSDHVLNDGFSDVYYFESEDGINWSNKAGTYTRDVSVLELSKSDIDTYYKVRTISPHFNQVGATCSWNNEPFYAIESPTTDGAIDFGYFNGSAWASKEITVSGVKLRDANRMELLATGEDSFILYCCEYATFSGVSTSSRIVKITTDDAFDSWSHEFLTDGSVCDYSVMANWNFTDVQKTPIFCLTPKVYGSGADTDPANSYANFKLVDVI